MKIRAFLYAIIIAVIPVQAAECSTLEHVRADIATFNPPVDLTEMGKDETEAFLHTYNAFPPVSSYHGDYSVVISRPQSNTIVYVYFENNCAIATLYMRREAFENIIKIAVPQPSGMKA